MTLHELASNTCQHVFSFDRRSILGLEIGDSGVQVALGDRDNGSGFPKGFNPYETESVEFEILQALVEGGLEGTMTFPENSMTTVEVKFELNRY